jgi:hypothetical protein
VLQVHQNSVILFHEGGVSQLAYPSEPYLYFPLARWANNGPKQMDDDPEQTGDSLEWFNDGSEQTDNGSEQSDDGPEQIWALVGMDPLLEEPAGIFKFPKTFFIINSTSPHSENPGWLKRTNHSYFYMKPWTFSEIIQVFADPTSRDSQNSPILLSPIYWNQV